MLPSTASPTSGSITTATIMDSMITTIPRRPLRFSEDLSLIYSRSTHVAAPREIGRTEISLGQIGYLASRQGDHAPEAGCARRSVGQIVRGRNIPTGAYNTGGGRSEGTCQQARVAHPHALNKDVLAQVRATGALRRIDVFHRREDKHAIAAAGGDVQPGRNHDQQVLVAGLREIQPRAVHSSRVAADLLDLQGPDQVHSHCAEPHEDRSPQHRTQAEFDHRAARLAGAEVSAHRVSAPLSGPAALLPGNLPYGRRPARPTTMAWDSAGSAPAEAGCSPARRHPRCCRPGCYSNPTRGPGCSADSIGC